MFVSLFAAAALAAAGPADMAEWHAACDGKEGFSDPAPPLHIFGNVYDVGTCEITVLLITSPKGHILLDAATEEAAPTIAANIERLGFRLKDIKRIGISHEHFDHVGGLAELQRRTGATLMSMPPAYLALQTGQPEKRDPQYGVLKPFPPARSGSCCRTALSSARPIAAGRLGDARPCPGQHQLVVAKLRERPLRQHRLRRQRDIGFGRGLSLL